MSDQNQVQVALQRIYLKDLSFESPDPIASFKSKWEPKVNLDMRNESKKLEGDLYESTLILTATVKIQDKTAFIIEVEQAGIFMLKGLEGEQLNRVLGTFCMNVLLPYARECIDSMFLKGSFPPLSLAPMHFEAMYEQSKKQQ